MDAYSKYLNDTVSTALAEAVAEAVCMQPQDPVEFVADYLLYWANSRDRLNKQQEALKQVAVERKTRDVEIERDRAAAAIKIQRQYREFLAAQREREERERKQVEELECRRQEQLLELDRKPVEVDEDGKSQQEVDLEKEEVRASMRFRRACEEVRKLDKDKIAELRRYGSPPPIVNKVLKAVLYLLGRTPKAVKTWAQIQQAIVSASSFLGQILAYDPLSVQKKAKFRRITAVLRNVDEDSVKSASFCAFILHDWLQTALELRERAVQSRKAQAEAGKEVQIPEEEDDEDTAGDDAGEDA